MGSLPSQESSTSYTYEEMQHIVAREVMKHRLSDLEAKLASVETNMTGLFAKLETSLHNLAIQLSKSSEVIKECREELKDEVEREFATKLELKSLEAKVDKMWAKITVAVSLSVVFIQYLLDILGIVK